ncbi:MAG: TGS domain-containing protein, partial [Acidimicrobiales bacterium]
MPTEITVLLPDGSARSVPDGTTIADLAASIGRRLAAAAVAAELDGAMVDLSAPLVDGGKVRIVTAETDEGRAVLRHSSAHVLAQAVLRLWPGARYAIGPAITDGFYYDFDLPNSGRFSDDDLERIDAEMRAIMAESQLFEREEHTISEGLEIFADQPYKREIIEGVAQAATGLDEELAAEAGGNPGAVSAYRNGPGFVDLCRGPHVPSTDRLGHFKLTRVAGAYWRGDEHRPQLQRIYG